MKAMILSDMLTAKKYLVQQLVVALLVGGFVCIVMENLYVVAPMLAVLIPFSLAFTIIALDERGDWQQFRLALPLSRADVVVGRYLSLGLLALIGMVTGLVLTGLVIAAAQLLPSVPQLANLMTNFSWQAVLFSSVIGLAVILFMLAITMPLVSRFGMTKAVRYLPLIVIIGVMLLLTGLKDFEAPAFLLDFIAWVATPAGTVAVAAGTLIIMLVLYALSATVAVKLYAKREL